MLGRWLHGALTFDKFFGEAGLNFDTAILREEATVSNWYGAAKSNFVKVKDLDALRKALEPWSIKIQENCAADGKICLLASSDEGGWPSWGTDEEGADVEFSFADLVVPHLVEGEVLVVVEAGHEGLRCITGFAEAFDTKGGRVSLGLGDIMELAAKEFKVDLASIDDPC